MKQNKHFSRINNMENNIEKDNFEKLFSRLNPPSPKAGLFDNIILDIRKKEGEKRGKRLFFEFLFLAFLSLATIFISGAVFITQITNSGVSYFVSTALSDLSVFFGLWQEFILAILELFPLSSLIIFLSSFLFFIFVLRFFIYKKNILIGYWKGNFI